MFKVIAVRAAFALAAVFPLAAQADAVPFKLVVQTKETLTLNAEACPMTPFLQGTTTGSGRGTQVGDASVLSTDCVTPGEGAFVFTGGRLVVTAANGDTLTMDYSGSLTPTGAFPVYAMSGSYRITGGTGRFANATGSGVMQGSNNLVSGAGAYTASGQISF